MRRVRTALAVIVAVLIFSSAALATVAWMKVFNDTYKPKADSDLKKAKCAVCHKQTNGKGGLNAYGEALKGKKVDAASLKAIESKDSDKDGVSNINEIKAGTNPGDPKSCKK